ncbi:hypothetical protein N431DRAFT_459822 [Stipitochalara longipes BDJ]|nr:hypothetical protein N431DRAFT_459822 [Stipitochalara longipes BDJ]
MSILKHIVIQNPTCYFWIDAICINQHDDEEKGERVRLMRNIYALAQKVIIWMGEASLDSDVALGYPSKQWLALVHLLERPWFQRVWIIQEVVASRRVTILCGDKMIEWGTFAELMWLIQEHHLERALMTDLRGNLKLPPQGYHNTIRILDFQNLNWFAAWPKLELALLRTRHFKATDARDNLFAIIGIFSDATDKELSPSYTESPAMVSVPRYPSLGGYRIWARIPDLPSWVPDWTSDPFTVLGQHPEDTRYAAWNLNFKPNITYKHIFNSIMLGGRIIDAVDRFVGSMYGTEFETSNLDERKKIGFDVSNKLTRASNLLSSDCLYHTGELIFPDVVGRTLTANLTDRLFSVDEYYPGYFSSYLYLCRLDASGCFIESTPEIKSGASLFAAAHSGLGAGRAVFATKNPYLGLGPPEIRKDDLVCIFIGFCTPFIIRKRSEGGFALVGECYVHGLMDGKGLEVKDVEDIELF